MTQAIGFKEWQVVCDALSTGRQSVILRKGGIHEGRHGFSFAHQSFFIFPTRFHAQTEHVREGTVKIMPEWQLGDSIKITHHAEALWAITSNDWQQVTALEPLHIYSDTTVRDRFDWQGKGMASGSIHIALVRITKLAQPWIFPYEKSHGGCRSWVNLPEPPADWKNLARPVVTDSDFSQLAAQLSVLKGA